MSKKRLHFKNGEGFIQNIVMIVILLTGVFLSQNAAFRPIAQHVYRQANAKISPYTTKAGEWFKASIYPRLNSEVEKRGEVIQEEATKQKDAVVQSAWEKFKNYFSEKFSKTFGTNVK